MKNFIGLLLLSATLILAQEVKHEIPEEEGVHVGELRGSEHSISGSLYALDENILLLKRFEYDGQAEDAFFWVGTSGDRPSTTGTILPYPFGGVFYQSEDSTAPFLFGVFNGSKDIRLTLPDELKVTDLKWFSIWSRAGKKSFGEVVFPSGFTLDKKFTSGSSVNSGPSNFTFENHNNDNNFDENNNNNFNSKFDNNNPSTHDTDNTFGSNTELPPPLLSGGNVHDPRRVDKWGNRDGQPEPEPETTNDRDVQHRQEHERFQPRKNAASNIFSSIVLLSVSMMFAKCL
jgi:hypothetical protein